MPRYTTYTLLTLLSVSNLFSDSKTSSSNSIKTINKSNTTAKTPANIEPIKEIATFSQVEKEIKDNNTLLIVSLDNVLLSSTHQMGSRSWFYHRMEAYEKKGLHPKLAASKALSEWTAIINIFPETLVSPDIAKSIQNLQQQKTKIIGLSSRGMGLASHTIEQLQALGIDLSKTSGLQTDIPLCLGERTLLYRGGVLFTSGTHKIKALKKLFDITQVSQPKKIVMVSHSAQTLKIVGDGLRLHTKNLSFTPVRYTAMDKKEAEFNPAVADIQFESFKQVLSNEEALKIYRNKMKKNKKK